MSIRVGILGGGSISETHARAASELPGVSVAAVFGENRSRASRLAERFGARAYDALEPFLDHPALDAVLIGSPSGRHAELALAALGRGVNVLVEKPLDISTERIDSLIAALEGTTLKLGVFFQDRTAPGIVWLKDLIASGGLGSPILVSAQVRWYRPPEYYRDSRWRGTRALDGGGALMNQGIHTVDLLLWLLGDVASVYARTRTALHEIEVEDTAVACLEFDSGAIGTLEAATSAYPGFARRIEVTGTEGTVVLESQEITVCELRNSPAEPPPRGEGSGKPRASSALMSDTEGHRRVIEDFVRAIESGAPPLCDAREGRRSVELIEAIYRSAASGLPVRLGLGAEAGQKTQKSAETP
ncbi:MAG: Gfo/Idh/MocA family protein [Longimicrobiales bacterium]